LESQQPPDAKLGLRWDKDFNMIGGADIKNSRTYQELVALNKPDLQSLGQQDRQKTITKTSARASASPTI